MIRLTIRISDELNARLKALSRRLGISKCEVARRALEKFVADPMAKSKVTCLDLMKDWIGSCDGPHDLSTNPKHMEGYGR